MVFLNQGRHIGTAGVSYWNYRGSVRGFSIGGANHHDVYCGGCGTGIWYYFTEIWSHSFTTDGDAVDTTGDLPNATNLQGGYSSETHSFLAGGHLASGGTINVIQSFQNVNPAANTTDLADLTTADDNATPVSSETHGYYVSTHGTFEKFAFTNTINATLVGNLANSHDGSAGAGASDSNADYGYVAGGGDPGSTDAIDRFSFANETTGDDVGNLTTAVGNAQAAGCSSETNGYFLGRGGQTGTPTQIERYTFSSASNATDVGDLSISGTGRGNGLSSTTHGYVTGGEVHFTQIDKFLFANEATWNDVGDLGTNQVTNRGHHASSHY